MKKKRSRIANFSGSWSSVMIDGIESIGCVCIMDLHGVRESRTDLAERLNCLDLPGSEIKLKREQSAFLDILKGMEKSGIIVKVDNTYEWITYQTNKVALDDAMTANGLTKASVNAADVVRFYKTNRGIKGGTIESDNPATALAIQELMDAERDMAKTNDVTEAIKRIVHREGDIAQLRKAGGVMFMPAPFYGLALKLEVFVDSLNGDNSFTLLPVPAVEKKKATVWKAVINEVEKNLDNIQKSQEKAYLAIANGRGKNRIQTIHDSYNEEIARAEIYADFLQMNAEKIVEELRAKKKAFAKKISSGFDTAEGE